MPKIFEFVSIRLKKLQEEMIDGGKRAEDKDLKERRKRKKKAAETRIKALGEALGHVDDEDGVLIPFLRKVSELFGNVVFVPGNHFCLLGSLP